MSFSFVKMQILQFVPLCVRISIIKEDHKLNQVRLTAALQLAICAFVIGIGLRNDVRTQSFTSKQLKELRQIAFKAEKKEAKLKAKHKVKKAKEEYKKQGE